MTKKIIRLLYPFHKKIPCKHYTLLAIFIFLFSLVSVFFVTRGDVPHYSELAYIEHSILGKDAGSVVPASCESGVYNGDGNYTDCPTQVCPQGNTITPAMGQVCNVWCPSHGVWAYPGQCPVDGGWTGWSACTQNYNYYGAPTIENGGKVYVAGAPPAEGPAGTTYDPALLSWVYPQVPVGEPYKYRTCTNPTPAYGGSYCVPASPSTKSCLEVYFSASPVNVSYNSPATLTWSSVGAIACTSGSGWTNSGTLNGSASTGNLTSSQTYNFSCNTATETSPIVSATVNVCPLSTPTWNGTACVPPTGTLTASSLTCTIPVGQSTCNVNLTWTTTNPYGTSAVTRNNPAGTVFTANNGGPSSVTLSGAYANVTYYLYNHSLELATVTITPSCAVGGTWNISTNRCEPDTIASLSANPTKVSNSDDSTLTWGSTYATNCSATGGAIWPYPGTLSGNISTGALTSTTYTYNFQCFGLGAPSPIRTATVNVCPSDNPILNKNDVTCQEYPTAITTFTGQFTPNGKIVVTGTNADSCEVTRTIAGVTNTISGVSPLSVNFSAFGTLGGRPLAGVYGSSCSYTDGNGTEWKSKNNFSIQYEPIPPKPIVTLRASPSNIPVNSQSVLTWKVTYPNSVQVPTQPACTLTAKPVCPQGTCNQSQLLASTTINNVIKNDNTDANDPNGTRKITSMALNEIIPYYNLTTNTGDTDWQAYGKKTFILNHSMDFMLRCGSGPNESQGVRVLVTSSTEG